MMGRIEALARYIEGKPGVTENLPIKIGVSYPVPVIKEDVGSKQVLMAFFYFYTTGLPPETPNVHAPEYVSQVNLYTRDIVDFHSVTSKDFGIDRDDRQPLGEANADDDLTMDNYRQLESRFYQLYDQILPWFENKDQALSSEQKQTESEFSGLFSILPYEVLHPYYHALNPSFFDWLKQNSQ